MGSSDKLMIASHQLKGRAPYPFETIAVAVAFSAGLAMVLNEAKHLARQFGSVLLLIHVGKRTPAKEAVLQEAVSRLEMERQTQMIWVTGDPVASLLKTCKENIVDLLLLEALQRETIFHYYLGSVARGLSRRAKCSLLLLTEPQAISTQFHRIVVDCVDHPKTMNTLQTAFYFARKVGATDVQMVSELDQNGLTMAMSVAGPVEERNSVDTRMLAEADAKLRKITAKWQTEGMTVTGKVLFGRPGYAIRNYAQQYSADLLVINSPDNKYNLMDRIFPHDMEYILEHLPCNLLIVHSRLAGEN